MILATLLCGYIGLLIFVLIAISFKRLNNNEEYGYIHLLMALMYAIWLPIPTVLYKLMDNQFLLVGSIFGFTYIVMMAITMILQTGHLVHSVKKQHEREWEERDNWMFATFGGPYEVFANILKGIWAIFLAISFYQMDDFILGSLMTLFGIFAVYFFILLLNISSVNTYKFLLKLNLNYIFLS